MTRRRLRREYEWQCKQLWGASAEEQRVAFQRKYITLKKQRKWTRKDYRTAIETVSEMFPRSAFLV